MARRSTVNMALAVAIAASTLVAPVDAIVRRHDVPDARYVIPDDYFPPLADIPIEGQGVLIAPTWVITAAHATQWQRKPIDHVMIAGKSRNVSQVIVHPGWKRVPQSEVGSEASRLATRLDNDDVALLRLSEPVTDVTPASIYRGEGEVGHIVEIIGKGQTGTGKDGIADDATHRTVLHRAQNRIESANGHWLTYRFDTGSRALPLEGIFGGGDSGARLSCATMAAGNWSASLRGDGQVVISPSVIPPDGTERRHISSACRVMRAGLMRSLPRKVTDGLSATAGPGSERGVA